MMRTIETLRDTREVLVRSIIAIPLVYFSTEHDSVVPKGTMTAFCLSALIAGVDHFRVKNVPHTFEEIARTDLARAEVYRVIENTKSILQTINPVLSSLIINSPINLMLKGALFTGLAFANFSVLYLSRRYTEGLIINQNRNL